MVKPITQQWAVALVLEKFFKQFEYLKIAMQK